MRKIVVLLTALQACVPLPNEGRVSVQVAVTGALERRQVNHFTFRLYAADRSLKGTYRSFEPAAVLQHVPFGTYFVTADAYASWDDSVSVSLAGAANSHNWVVVDHQGARYSEGQALQTRLTLRTLLVGVSVREGGYQPISVTPH